MVLITSPLPPGRPGFLGRLRLFVPPLKVTPLTHHLQTAGRVLASTSGDRHDERVIDAVFSGAVESHTTLNPLLVQQHSPR